jgi:hypothetical protein
VAAPVQQLAQTEEVPMPEPNPCPIGGSTTAGDVTLGAVVFDAPDGTEAARITAAAGPLVPFGRGGNCTIRFGHAPRPDLRLARRAGTFVITADRIAVESSRQPDHAPLQIRAPGRPPVEISGGEIYAPSGVEFEVVARGDRLWTMTVRVRRFGPVPTTDTEPPTDRYALELSRHEQDVLAAYVAPQRAGLLEPATHAQVAESLHYSSTKVRFDLYSIWAKLVAAGVPVPDLTDKRLAVGRAVLMNNILPVADP